ncbi:MAG: aquaporin [bacterium]
MNKYVTEFIGTFFLVLTIGLSSNPLAIGFVLAALVYMGGHISGANYNPAVSLGIFMRKKLNAKDLIMYWIFQLLGAIVAALVCKVLMGKTFAPAPAPGVSFLNAVVVEFLFTFALVLVVLNVATTRKNEGNSYFGLAIGITVLGAAFSGGPISGGAFNPAVGIGAILVDTMSGGSSMSNIPIYIVGPFLGGAVASIIFKMTNPDEYQNESLTYHE